MRNPAKATPAAPDVDQLISELKPLGRPILTSPSGPAGPGASASTFQAQAPTPSGGSARPRSRLRPILPPMKPMMVRGCVALGVVLSAAITQWPYGHACGVGLSFYIYAVTFVVISGIWGLLLTWKSRLGITHAVALVTLVWGLALGAGILLPRIGYAKSAACWRCQAAAARASANAVPSPAPGPLPDPSPR